ncbi:MAG: GNAT family N-acetyltransferase [Beijerinckiaceae bacterium]|jgi:RimJ/RimL family protein N-acetyltransferase|nr:GNAT family N-acetyltransferase [Beijerinckiaceae bacterium]
MFPDLITDDAFRLETSRLWLRWPRVADAVTIAKLAGVPAVSQFTTNVPHPYHPKQAEDFILGSRRGNLSGDQSVLAITCKGKPGEAIGMIGLHGRSNGSLALGFWLAEPFWNQGLLAEALDETLALGFVTTKAPRINAMLRDDNEKSRNLLESRGFTITESLRVNMPLRGGIFPCSKYALNRDGWQARELKRFEPRQSATDAAKNQSDNPVSGKSGGVIRGAGVACLHTC